MRVASPTTVRRARPRTKSPDREDARSGVRWLPIGGACRPISFVVLPTFFTHEFYGTLVVLLR